MINGVILPVSRNLLTAIIKSFFKQAHEHRKDTAGLEVTPFRTYLFGVARCKLVCKIIRRIRLRYFKRVVQMEISWFDKTENPSVLISAEWSADAVSVGGLVGNRLPLLFQNTVSAISGLFITFMGKWQLAYIVLVLLPLSGFNRYIQLRFFNEFSADAKKKYEQASEVACVGVGSIRTIVSFGAQDEMLKLHENKYEGPRRAGIKQGLVRGAGFGSPMLFLRLVYTFNFYIGAYLFVKASKNTFPTLFQEFLGLSLVAMGVSPSRSFAPNSGKAKTVAASVFNLLDQKSKIEYTDDLGYR